jgi:hypothetical protein
MEGQFEMINPFIEVSIRGSPIDETNNPKQVTKVT